jgi:Protein of unknown function (DUF3551)
MMPIRTRALSLLLAAVALIGAAAAGHAQSAYSYPWCARYPRGIGGFACYYTSFQQCMTTMDGIGGYCMQSPFYRGPTPAAGPAPGRRNKHRGVRS